MTDDNKDEYINLSPPKTRIVDQMKDFFEDVFSFLGNNFKRALAVAVTTGFAIFEIDNAKHGAMRVFPGRDDMILLAGALGAVLGLLFLNRQWGEARRAFRAWRQARKQDPSSAPAQPDPPTAWMITTAFCALVLLGFVWSNVSAESVLTDEEVSKSKKDFALLISKRDTLQSEYDGIFPPLTLEVEKVTLAGLEAEAQGWGMSDLKVDGACKEDLDHQRMRDLCNQAVKLRAAVIRGEATVKAKSDKLDELTAAQEAVLLFRVKTGNEQYEAMAKAIGGTWTKEKIQAWFLLLMAAGMLSVSMRTSDWLMEEWENRDV